MNKNGKESKAEKRGVTRREFLGSSAALAGGALIGSTLPVDASAWVAGSDELRIALIGSGARGRGAVVMALQSGAPVKLVAMADIFRDILDRSYETLTAVDEFRGRIDVPEERKLIGLDAYKEAIELADVVILATPPAFRPIHFKAAVEAGKHAFLEKAVATDSPGVRTVLEAGRMAEEKGLTAVVGLQNRFNIAHQELVKRVKEGMIGEVVAANTEYLIGNVTLHRRQPGWGELEYQLRNWRYFNWLWGGSPAGLNIHHSDIVHWVKGSWPVQAHGVGGRGSLEGPDHGDIFDSYYIEYLYEDGTKLHSPVRVIDGCRTNSAFYLQGAEGTASIRDGIRDLEGELLWSHRSLDDPSPFQRTMDLFFRSVQNGEAINHAKRGAHSSLASIMGRMACHAGQVITWEEALNSDLVLVPEFSSMQDAAPVQPDENGSYPVPVPGRTRVV